MNRCVLLAARLLVVAVISPFLSAQAFRLADPIMGKPKEPGWSVGNGLGELRLSLPIGKIPGEIPLPVSMTMGGNFQAYPITMAQNIPLLEQPIFGTCGFGYIGSSINASMNAPASYLVLEDGRVKTLNDFSSRGEGSGLLACWGLTAASSKVSADGVLLWANQTVVMGGALSGAYGERIRQNLPTGIPLALISMPFGPPQQRYQMVADKNLLRVYAEVVLEGKQVGLPVLIADRFNHYVTFKWTQVTTGLPAGITSLVRVDVLNQRGQGAAIRYANWNDNTVVHDLMRVDAVNCTGPSALIQGYSGGSRMEPVGFARPYGAVAQITPSVVGGMTSRPVTQILGDPLTVPQPSWNNTGSPAGSAPALPTANSGIPSKIWQFHYDANLAELVSFSNPEGVNTAFSFDNYSLYRSTQDSIPLLTRGVGQAVETDSSQAIPTVRTRSWVRSVPKPWSTAWTVAYQDYWSNVGPADSTTTFTYASLGTLDYCNGFLLSETVKDNAGAAWSTITNTSTTVGFVGGGLDGYMSIPATVNRSRMGETPRRLVYAYSDATGLQPTSMTGQVLIGDTWKTFEVQEVQYNSLWTILEPIQAKQVKVTRYNTATGAALTPVSTTTNVWDTGTLLQLQATYLDAGQTLQHGRSSVFDNVSGSSTYGKMLSQDVWHREYSSTKSSSPNTTTYQYDSSNGLTKGTVVSFVDYPSGTGSLTTSISQFDGAGNPICFTDEKGVETQLSNDLFGRRTREARQGESEIITTYPDLQTKVEVRSSMSKTIHFDGFGRTILQTLPDGISLAYAYDVHGNLASTTKRGASGVAGHSVTASTVFDLLGRATTTAAFDGSTVSTTYSALANGANARIETSGGNATTTLTDAFGQVISVCPPSGDITERSYDGMANLVGIKVTPQNGAPVQIRTYVYDGLRRRISKTEPETGTQTFGTFTALNAPKVFTQASGRARTWQYDGLGRVRAVSGSFGGNSAQVSYGYSGAFLSSTSNTLTMGSVVDTTTEAFAYWPAVSNGARLKSETTTQAGLSRTTSYAYSDLGELAQVTYPSGRVVTYAFDAVGRVNEVSTNLEGKLTMPEVSQFDEWGSRQLTPFKSGASDRWAVDSTMARVGSLVLAPKVDASLSFSYSYKPGTGFLAGTGEWYMPCDASGRLIQAVGNGLTFNYAHDGYGNNTSSLLAIGSFPRMNNFTFDAATCPMTTDRLPNQAPYGAQDGVVYTSDGEISTINTKVSSPDWLSMIWDPFGRLSSVTQHSTTAKETYRYNASGVRVARTDSLDAGKSCQYVYGQDLLLAEYAGSGSWRRDVIYLEGRAIAEIDINGVHELHCDHLGTPRIITSGTSGRIEGVQTFSPYGELIASSGYAPLIGYTGHQQTEPNDLIYMRGRFYMPAWHQFLNCDQGADPQSLNQYAYASGSPLSRVDPTGMFSWGLFNDFTDMVRDFFKVATAPFRGNLKQILSKLTYQCLQETIGVALDEVFVLTGQVRKVDFRGGATLVTLGSHTYVTPVREGNAFTLGSMITAPKGTTTDSILFMHEYGHYLQSQAMGPRYLFWAIDSVRASKDHEHYSVETDADRRAIAFFGLDMTEDQFIKELMQH